MNSRSQMQKQVEVLGFNSKPKAAFLPHCIEITLCKQNKWMVTRDVDKHIKKT